ncbi:MAG: hypothetical protein WD673_09565 [Alphaproteobacteria bacterium]
MSRHRYPGRVLALDYARAGAGLALTAGPLALVPAAPAVAWTLGVMAALFAAFGARTAARQATWIACDDESISAQGPLGTTMPWRELSSLSLRFYATKRDRSRGWMQLRLRGRGRSITVESSLEGFDAIVRAAWEAARANGVGVSDTTRANLGALGLATDGEAGSRLGWAGGA